MLQAINIEKVFNAGSVTEKTALNGVSIDINDGDFITVIGGNGAGKSTLLNALAGQFPVTQGRILLDGNDITKKPEYKRAKYIGRVFQDPLLGTAGGMNLEENLALAARRGRRRGLRWGITKEERVRYFEELHKLNLGLEGYMSQKVSTLSGGQRQALTLLMATVVKPRLLLLDEHTAALDPKTAALVLEITERLTSEHRITTLMVTHNMKDAIRYGNRLVMMSNGKIIFEAAGEEKKKLEVLTLLAKFESAGGTLSDRMLLAK